jgi:hypothetical protein
MTTRWRCYYQLLHFQSGLKYIIDIADACILHSVLPTLIHSMLKKNVIFDFVKVIFSLYPATIGSMRCHLDYDSSDKPPKRMQFLIKKVLLFCLYL